MVSLPRPSSERIDVTGPTKRPTANGSARARERLHIQSPPGVVIPPLAQLSAGTRRSVSGPHLTTASPPSRKPRTFRRPKPSVNSPGQTRGVGRRAHGVRHHHPPSDKRTAGSGHQRCDQGLTGKIRGITTPLLCFHVHLSGCLLTIRRRWSLITALQTATAHLTGDSDFTGCPPKTGTATTPDLHPGETTKTDHNRSQGGRHRRRTENRSICGPVRQRSN